VFVRFHGFNGRIVENAEWGMWLVAVDEIEPTTPS